MHGSTTTNENERVLEIPFEVLDAHNKNQFGDLVNETPAQIGQGFCLDLINVKFMDSAGLGAIVATIKQIRNLGGEIVIQNVSVEVRSVFERVQMSRLVEIR